MCGIAGAIGGAADARLSAVEAMIALMAHRGPDSAGVAPLADAALGMCQLRIRETRPRAMPLALGEESARLVAYNGEVYSGFWTDERAGGRVPQNVEEEVQAILSMQEGAQSPDGMFALATTGAGDPRVVCWRDVFGIKPLYWRQHAGTTLFASELRALAEVRARPPLRRAGIAEFLLFGRCVGRETFYEGVVNAPPGAELAMSADAVQARARRPFARREARAVGAELRAAIRDSLRHTMIAERRLGLALSGGLDSTILAAELSLMGVEGLHTFSVNVAGSDDGCESLATLELPGDAWRSWTHHSIHFTPAQLRDGLARSVALAAEPTRMTSFPLYLSLADAVKAAGVVVLLCGEGADELFGGYKSYRKWLGKHVGITLDELQDYACPREKEASLRSLIGDGPVDDARARFGRQLAEYVGRPAFDGLRQLEEYLRLEPLLHRTDLALMALSIEGRVPYLHGRLPAIAQGLTLDDCLSAQQTKIALREAYREVLPMARATAPKTNFRAPMSDWFRGPLASWLKSELGASEALLVAHGLDGGALASLRDATLGGDSHAAAVMFGVISLGMFLRMQNGERLA